MHKLGLSPEDCYKPDQSSSSSEEESVGEEEDDDDNCNEVSNDEESPKVVDASDAFRMTSECDEMQVCAYMYFLKCSS